jgi:acyl-CoA synthetase (AMP-forming)/AMP-acid ligase II
MSNIKNVSKFLKDFSNIKLVIGERFVSYLPLNHIAAQMMDIYMPIALVGTVWFADNNALKNSLVTTLKDCSPTIFMGVPRIWEKIKEQIEKELSNHFAGDIYKYFASGNIIKNIGLDHCKLCVSGAGVLPNSVADFFESIGITLYDLYGMSETTGIISMSCPNRYKKGSVGKPLMRVMIDKDKEILVKGNNLFSGYYGKKKLTKESMKNGWFKTGDLGFIDNDGYLFIIGRKKELIVTSGGENIAPVLIEDKIINETGDTYISLKGIEKMLRYDDINKKIINGIIKYDNHDIVVIVDENGTAWFYGRQICKMLGYKNTTDVICNLTSNNKKYYNDIKNYSQYKHNIQDHAVFINEFALCKIALTTRMPGGEKLYKWITNEFSSKIQKHKKLKSVVGVLNAENKPTIDNSDDSDSCDDILCKEECIMIPKKSLFS